MPSGVLDSIVDRIPQASGVSIVVAVGLLAGAAVADAKRLPAGVGYSWGRMWLPEDEGV